MNKKKSSYNKKDLWGDPREKGVFRKGQKETIEEMRKRLSDMRRESVIK